MSMDIDKIITLIGAGYTKEEINQMMQPAEQAQPEAQEEKAPVDKPDIEPEKEPEKGAPANDDDRINQLVQAMEKMSSMIIHSNINRTVTDGAPDRSIDDVLAEVINPPRKQKGGNK